MNRAAYVKHGEAEKLIWFRCPACSALTMGDEWHIVPTAGARKWTFNKNLERPTLHPSVMVEANGATPRCHFYVIDGHIHYLKDCSHKMAGKMIELPEAKI